ncbi:MAG TPA: tetratricopeptide repeat protein [Candidatus Acidoferrales bacterium]|nr:tetratricopeptide repeat protein [Candidatus Acidoferrales bacterium]
MGRLPFSATVERALRDVEDRLKADPASVDLRYERASLLEVLGHMELARMVYAGILAKRPGDARALNALGRLLYKTGARTAAQSAFAEAASKHPDDLASHINLAYTFVFTSRFEDARRHYERALELDPEHQMAHQGLAYVLDELGDSEGAARHRVSGFQAAISEGSYRGDGEPVRVLLVCSAFGGTVSTAQFLDERIFLTAVLVVELFKDEQPLPPHHVVFNAIGDADRCAEALVRAKAILARTDAPVVNQPDRVLATGRLQNAARLRALDGVVTPQIREFTRSESSRVAFTYPILLRAPGFHTGRFFVKVDSADDLAAAIDSLPGETVLAIEYLDGRGADGKYRKFRAIMVDGELYPLHLAISSDWKVHYGSAQMSEAAHRAEEERFLSDMPTFLGERTMRALRSIVDAMALEFGGIDFGVDANANVLLYESNATMTVVIPEQHDTATYRRLPAERIVLAVIKMLARLSARVDRLRRP